LPVGVQVIARFGDDVGALRAARFVEEALAQG
jgi:Asp-tRNA(Asn)/Glu-tRNA(Gln) amidotransferase A subunit family amidase